MNESAKFEKMIDNATEVTVIDDMGGIGLGKVDIYGRLVYRAGQFIPTTDPDLRDEMYRRDVVDIIYDNGDTYKNKIRMLYHI